MSVWEKLFGRASKPPTPATSKLPQPSVPQPPPPMQSPVAPNWVSAPGPDLYKDKGYIVSEERHAQDKNGEKEQVKEKPAASVSGNVYLLQFGAAAMGKNPKAQLDPAAWEAGYKAGLDGKTPTKSPPGIEKIGVFFAGVDEGKSERASGLIDDIFGAIRVIGDRDYILENLPLTKYAREELSGGERFGQGLLVAVTAWSGKAPPKINEPKLVKPFYLIDDICYYDPWIRWGTRKDELDRLTFVGNIPLTDAEKAIISVLQPYGGIRSFVVEAPEQFLQQKNCLQSSYIKSATESQLQHDAQTAWRDRKRLGTDLDNMVGELVLIGKVYDFRSADGKPDPRAREIGQSLFESGGQQFMRAVWWRVHYSQNKISMQSLNNCWDGIGGWTS